MGIVQPPNYFLFPDTEYEESKELLLNPTPRCCCVDVVLASCHLMCGV